MRTLGSSRMGDLFWKHFLEVLIRHNCEHLLLYVLVTQPSQSVSVSVSVVLFSVSECESSSRFSHSSSPSSNLLNEIFTLNVQNTPLKNCDGSHFACSSPIKSTILSFFSWLLDDSRLAIYEAECLLLNLSRCYDQQQCIFLAFSGLE